MRCLLVAQARGMRLGTLQGTQVRVYCVKFKASGWESVRVAALTALLIKWKETLWWHDGESLVVTDTAHGLVNMVWWQDVVNMVWWTRYGAHGLVNTDTAHGLVNTDTAHGLVYTDTAHGLVNTVLWTRTLHTVWWHDVADMVWWTWSGVHGLVNTVR
jgi:hypothetical protein